jgi:3-keto-disaccharide hydrolase
MHLQHIRPLSSKRILMCGVCAGLILVIVILAVSSELAAQDKSKAAHRSEAAIQPNTLAPAERAAGWKLLFDGKTWNGWRGFRREKIPVEGWMIEDGTIKHLAGRGEQSQQGGDIITIGQYDNFELQLEWRISPGGNSGVKYLVAEEMVKSGYSGLGFEMQVLDDDRHPDAKMGKAGNRTASALYDLIAPKNKVLRPVGEWNQARLIIRGDHVEHWLNGAKVVEYDLGSTELKALIAESKYKDIAGFGEVRKGHILLQDHGNEVWFRNIKLRELPPK